MTIKITVSHSVSQHGFARVQALAADLPICDVRYNGAEIIVDRDDWTAVDDPDELRGASLLAAVYRAIDG